MNPNLEFAQAIHGRVTGRGTGIIDTVHLVEVARAASLLEAAGDDVRRWFADYLTWMTRHQYGKDERDAKNNHGTCWVLQTAEFARFTHNVELTAFCRERFKTVLVPTQIAADGSFPLELARTKPYGYCLFNLDAMATTCQILSTADENLWRFALPDGRGIAKAVAFMFPFVADKRTWSRPPDVMYFDGWPLRHPACKPTVGPLPARSPPATAAKDPRNGPHPASTRRRSSALARRGRGKPQPRAGGARQTRKRSGSCTLVF